MRTTNPKRDVAVIFVMMASLIVPIVLTMMTIESPRPSLPLDASSPRGYTVSLLLFVVPLLTIGVSHLFSRPHPVERKAMLAAVATVTLLGAMLDIMFGYAFFTFPSPESTLGIRVSAWSWSELRWIPDYLPIEEFGFYVLGGLFMVVVYMWADHHWLRDYQPDDYRDQAKQHVRLLGIEPSMLVLAAALIGLAVAYKQYSGHVSDGFPGYFVFLVLLALLPTTLLFRAVRSFVNWRAFGFTFGLLVLISFIWEASLALPYHWWAYREEEMLGLFVGPWTRLPVEAVLLWLLAAWGAVMAYEAFRIFFHMERKILHALFGIRPRRTNEVDAADNP